MRVLALVLVPYLAIPFYFLGGKPRTGKDKRRFPESEKSFVNRKKCLRETLQLYGRQCRHSSLLEEVSGLPILGENRLDLLVDGEGLFPSLNEALEEATDYILTQFYIVRSDETGREYCRRLVQAAGRGVRVYLYYDPLEDEPSEEVRESLRRAGVKWAKHRPVLATGKLFHINFRNHRKVTVVDGRVAFFGGLNVGDEYLSKVEDLSPWRDTHLRLQGPAVLQAQLSFLLDFGWATGHLPSVSWDSYEPQDSDVRLLLARTGPYDTKNRCRLIFLQALQQAQRSIWIATPFLSPDEAVCASLELACARGVEVRILLPCDSEVGLAELVAWDYIERFHLVGVRFFRQSSGSMHQKVVLVDEHLTLMGSANFDYRSFHLNHEVVAWVESESFAMQVGEMLNRDFEDSAPIRDQDIERTRYQRFRTSLARVVALLVGG